MKNLNEIQVYKYKGQKVFLTYSENMPNVTPLYDCTEYDLSCYRIEDYNGCDAYTTVDDDYFGLSDNETPITNGVFVCIENEQKLTEGWVTIPYLEQDYIRRELAVKTDKYYDWTSELSEFIDSIWRCVGSDIRKTGEVNFSDFSTPKWEQEWQDICQKIISQTSLTIDEVDCDIPTLEDIMKQEFDMSFNDIEENKKYWKEQEEEEE